MDKIRFENPYIIIFLIPIFLLFYFILIKGYVKDGFPISSIDKIPLKFNIIKFLKFLTILLSLLFLIIGSSSPLYLLDKIPIEEKGHAFVFCLDISSTMKALDYYPQSRLDKAKEVIESFIKNRKFDFFGIVIFAKYSIPYIPLTSDKKFILSRLREIELDLIEDGTAMGNAIISAIEQLSNYKGESKNIILITDGINNDGYIHPIYAANEAKKNNIKIYPIAIGTTNLVQFPFKDSKGTVYTRKISIPVDYELIFEISKIAGNGEKLIGENSKELQKIFKDFDRQKPNINIVK
ncbi:MAG: VWA domain-containing protein, partial [Exilispira sp.]